MDLMDDESLKKSVIDQMMGELDGVTADSLRKPKGPVKGVEVAITISPKSEEEMSDDDEDEHDIENCEDPTHDHSAAEAEDDGESGDYISQLLKKMG